MREAIAMHDQLYPDGNHPDVALTRNTLANLQRDQELFDESLASYATALDLAERSLGRVHSTVATILIESSRSLRALGRYDEAEAALLRAVSISEATEGPESVAAASLKNSLSGFYEDTGRLDLARDTQLEVLRVLRLNFGDEHPYVGITLSNIARTERIDGDLEAAETYGREALELHLKVGSPTPNRASARYSLATTLIESGKLPEALELLEATMIDHEEYLEAGDKLRTSVAAETEALRVRLATDRE